MSKTISQSHLEALVNSLDGIVWEADPSTLQFSFVSSQAERLLGYPLKSWLEESDFWRTHLHPDDRKWAPDFHASKVAQGLDHEFEYRMLAADGREVWLNDVVSVVEDNGGLTVRGVMIDVSQRHRTETALARSEERLRTVIHNAPVVMFALECDGTVTLSEGKGLAALGLESGEVVGRNVFEVFPNATAFHDMLRRALAGEEVNGSVELEELVFECRLRRVDDDKGVFEGVIGVATDVTEHRRADAALKESEERYALAIKGANDGLWDWNLLEQKIYYSLRWISMLGYSEDEISSDPQEWLGRVHPDDIEQLQIDLDAHVKGASEHLESEHRVRHKNGSYLSMLCRGIAVSQDGRAYRMAGSQTDISDWRRAEEQLRHTALHDELTGLPNRALFLDHLSRAVARARRGRRPTYQYAVLLLDLDRFKVVVDSLGHMVGDGVLVEISQRLRSCLRPGDLLARLGGDEFAILLDDIAGHEDARSVADRVQGELQRVINTEGHEVFTTASLGVAVSRPEYEDHEDVLRDADTALYSAKASGRARYAVFNSEMHARAVALQELETDLRRVVDRGEFVFQILYQPIVNLVTGRVAGFEALVRWPHPTRGMIQPADFIPIAEETGLIVPIGHWMIRESCAQMKAWQDRFATDPPLAISVNLSNRQFSQPDLPRQVAAVLAETGLEPSLLRLEITESTIMENVEIGIEKLERLRELDVKLQVDDFGTGYSSLSYLCRFPIDALKVDRSFVSNIDAQGQNSEILSTIVTLSRHLGMAVIAEGVETPEQLALLRRLECELGQGYFFSKPVTPEEAERLIADPPVW